MNLRILPKLEQHFWFFHPSFLAFDTALFSFKVFPVIFFWYPSVLHSFFCSAEFILPQLTFIIPPRVFFFRFAFPFWADFIQSSLYLLSVFTSFSMRLHDHLPSFKFSNFVCIISLNFVQVQLGYISAEYLKMQIICSFESADICICRNGKNFFRLYRTSITTLVPLLLWIHMQRTSPFVQHYAAQQALVESLQNHGSVHFFLHCRDHMFWPQSSAGMPFPRHFI